MNNTTDESIPCDEESLPDRQVAVARTAARQPEVKSRSWFSFIMALLKEAILVRIAPRKIVVRIDPRIPADWVEEESGLRNGVAKPEVLVPHLAETQPRSR
jgi:hypothetical protein